ncbi:Uncharacterised protein [Mycobacteroides abscessus subsp. abscessus]|nr:Uncharacterised protein [Mycobacteroides abscessus subsp. abscessus]SIC80267.1 Uncharacterised protein [Mycobacteroides abscessus subsp. abscessus]SKK32526.1 Uncharacterised protein [Mycobacteroides abscessus subsp. abscessus]SKP26188.1 Uncharacterised protein [Mycobacteroides abscessus subsp. abscessus]
MIRRIGAALAVAMIMAALVVAIPRATSTLGAAPIFLVGLCAVASITVGVVIERRRSDLRRREVESDRTRMFERDRPA